MINIIIIIIIINKLNKNVLAARNNKCNLNDNERITTHNWPLF